MVADAAEFIIAVFAVIVIVLPAVAEIDELGIADAEEIFP
jgi:hypothetical protein